MLRFGLIGAALCAAILGSACVQTETTTCGDSKVICPAGWVCIADLSACIDPLATTCGNGVQDEGEACDDGNFVNHDGCNFDCKLPRCGDGFKDTVNGVLEVCDDGNDLDNDGCTKECDSTEVCGDGVTNDYPHGADNFIESCDEGVTVNTPTCNANCTVAFCGDGITNPEHDGEECDGGNPNDPKPVFTSDCNDDCSFSRCGDGIRNLVDNEECDVGSYCADKTTTCTSNEDCVGIGDGACGAQDLDCCTKSCRNPLCGDGVIQPFCAATADSEAHELEKCDDGKHCADLISTCVSDADCVGHGIGGDSTCKPRSGALTKCDATCTSPEECGDGTINNYAPYNEVCDLGKRCADDIVCTKNADCVGHAGTSVPADETCVARRGHGCAPDCKTNESCGDGVKNDYEPYNEVCDDGKQCAVDGPACKTQADCVTGTCKTWSGDKCSDNCLSTEDCGNGIRELGEECDYGPLNGTVDIPEDADPPVRCSSQCSFNQCGNLRFDPGEQCDDGLQCADGFDCTTGADCVGHEVGGDADCKAREGDGCDLNCIVEAGWDCPDTLATINDPCLPICGDFLVRGFETCDDQNKVSGDGCSSTCAAEEGWDCPIVSAQRFGGLCGPICGNGIKSGDENCDDNDLHRGTNVLKNGDGCNTSCDIEVGWLCPDGLHCVAECGDGLRRDTETCDNGKQCSNGNTCNVTADCAGIGDAKCITRANDGCDLNCQKEDGWTCFGSPAGPGGPCLEVCGDGDVVGAEKCDDGDAIGGDGCDANCQVETGWDCPPDGGACTAKCGDGIVRAAGGETCDEGAATASGGCVSCTEQVGWTCPPSGGLCQPTCGDGRVRGIETCDDNNVSGGDGCSGVCQKETGWTCPTGSGVGGICSPVCDDGLLRGDETCDEGPAIDTGGCVSCQRQEGWTCSAPNTACKEICGDGLKVGTEGCDEGDLNSNSSDCTLACVAATCNDLFTRSQTNVVGGPIETDLNCGIGPGGAGQCPLCVTGKRCLSNADCLTNFCNPFGSVCAVPGRLPDELRMHIDDTQPLVVDVALLLDNDSQKLLESFSVGEPSCGSVTFDPDAETVAFDPNDGVPCEPPVTPSTLYKATFDYTVCPTDDAAPELCSPPTLVTVIINRDPTLVFPSSCVAVGTTGTTVNVAQSYTDPDGNPLDDTSIVPSSDDNGIPSANASVVTWEPDDPDVAGEYHVLINACDNVSSPPFEDAVGCNTATWTVRWSDAPKVTSYGDGDALPLLVGTSKTINAYGSGTHVIDDTPSGVSIGAAAFANGPTFGISATTSLGGLCTVNPGTAAPGDETVAFVAGSTPGTDSCFVQVCESCSGIQICSVTRLPFKVIQAPVANDDAMTALNGPPATGTIPKATLLANDANATGTFTLLNTGATTCGGTVSNGTTLTYTGPTSPSPTCLAADSFSYRVCSVDIPSLCDDATVNITIGRFPVAVADTKTTPEDTALVFPATDLLVNDTDPDNDPLTVISVGSPTNGTVVLSGGTITFTPTPLNFNGAGSFTYTISDGKTLSATASVAVTISPVNDAPTITSGTSASVAENSLVTTVIYTATSIDPDTLDTILWTLTGTDANAFNISAAGAVTLKAQANFEAKSSYSINVVGTDSGGLAATRAVTITVTPVNEAPTVTSGATASIAERAPISTVIYTATATDPDASDTIAWSVSGTDGGAFDIAANGALTLKASADFEAKPSYSINVVAMDSGGLSSTKAVVITVLDANDPPVAVNDSGSTNEDVPFTVTNATLLLNDTDPDLPANTLTVTGVGGPVNGSVAQGGTSVTFTPATNFSGAASFTYTISDGAGGTATATVNITVNAQNDAPVLDASKTPVVAAVDEDSVAPTGAVGTLVSALVDLNPPAGGLDNVTDVDPTPSTGIAITAADTTNGTWRYSINNGSSWQTIGTVSDGTARLLAADANTRIHFQPTTLNFVGSATITFRAWDTVNGTNGNTASTTTNGGTTSFSTVTDDATVSVTPINDAPVLDNTKTPVLAAVAEDAGVPSGTVGTLVSTLVDFATPSGQVDNVTDVDSGAALGIAVVAIDETNGTWFFSTNDGGAWTPFSAASATNTLLLLPTARVFFRPATNFASTAALTFRAWDTTSGSNGTFVNTSTNGGITAFSSATDTAATTVTPVNDAPTLDAAKSPALASVPENAPAPIGAVGTLVSALVDLNPPVGGLDNVTEVDAGSVTGLAVTNAVNTNGSWFYTIDGGGNWLALGSPTNATARLLAADANTRLYYRPNTSSNASATITFRAWDTTSGSNGGQVDAGTGGGITAFSSGTDTAIATVDAINDAPVLLDTAVVLTAINEDAGAPVGVVGTLVSSLVDLNPPAGGQDNVTDADSGAVTGMAITAADTANGTWHYTLTNGSSWLPLGAVAGNSSRLLPADANTRLYFQPAANFSGNATITFRAWDTTEDSAGTLANTNSNGGAKAYSSTTDTASITVNAVPDSPTATNKDAAETYVEDTNLNLIDIVVADVDSSTVTATLTLSNTSAGSLTTGTFGGLTSTFAAGVWSANGAIADVNSALAAVTFVPAGNFNAPFTITTNFNDGTSTATTGSKAVTGTAVNDTPAVTGPSTAYTATLTTLRGGGIALHGAGLWSFADVDATGSDVLEIAFTSTGTGAEFEYDIIGGTDVTTVVTPNGSSVVVRGTLTQLNALLAGTVDDRVFYTSDSSAPGPDVITIELRDLGVTGTGGAKTASATANVDITGAIQAQSAGAGHQCAILDGSLYCWGLNDQGQVGNGSTTNAGTAVHIGVATNWTAIAAGYDHTCGIRSPGELYCWGRNNSGQLGTNDTTPTQAPLRIGTDNDWSAISAGKEFTCGRRGGSLYCWGDNAFGSAGSGTIGTDVLAPTQVGSDTNWGAIATGQGHVCGIRAGALYCFGAAGAGQLGDNTTTDRTTVGQVGVATNWTSIAAGMDHTCGVRGAELYCWGGNARGQLGTGNTTPQPTPTKIGTATDWGVASAGFITSCATRTTGALYCWGGNPEGQVGDNTVVDKTAPTQLPGTTGWTSSDNGQGHTCAIRNQELYCWGSSSFGQLGDGGQTRPFSTPVHVGSASNWTALHTGPLSSCGIAGGALFCWGRNLSGEVGDGSLAIRATPTQVGSDVTWTAVTVGGSAHACGIKATGLYCWGNDTDGQIGDGATNNATNPTPVQISTPLVWTAVAAGGAHTCGISVGELYCWGNNGAGQLGLADTTPRSAPVKVGTATDWIFVTAGANHTCGIRGVAAGSLYCWGGNGDGQLGTGNTTPQNVPTQVGAATDWSFVDGGQSNTCGLRAGALYCWGNNSQGTIGDGTTTPQNAPTRVGLASDWTKVAVGGVHAGGIRGGMLFTWGGNTFGQLGDGTLTTPKLAPGQVGSATNWSVISSVANTSCGVSGGGLYCWGSNANFQHGTGAPWGPAAAVLVP